MRRLLFAMTLLSPGVALAQNLSPLPADPNAPAPGCGPDMDGQVVCRFGVIYECEYIEPGSMQGRMGWRWMQDSLRACDTTPAPADLPTNTPPAQFPGMVYSPQLNAPTTPQGQGTGQSPFSPVPPIRRR